MCRSNDDARVSMYRILQCDNYSDVPCLEARTPSSDVSFCAPYFFVVILDEFLRDSTVVVLLECNQTPVFFVGTSDKVV